MAHVPADGPLGLEGELRVKDDTSNAEVVARGYHRPELSSWIKLDRVTGLHGLGDADDFRAPAAGRIGELRYPGASRGKTIVYEGRLCGQSLQDLRQLAAKVRRIGGEGRQDSDTVVTHADIADPALGYFAQGVTLQMEIDDEQLAGQQRLPTPWQRPFIWGIRLADPRWKWGTQQSDTGNAGGATVEIDNQGDAPDDPSFVIRGAMDPTLTIENVTYGRVLQFDDLPIDGTQRLILNFAQRAASRPDQAEPVNNPNVDMLPYLNEGASDWWDALVYGLNPGAQDIRVTGCGGTWDISYYHRAW